MEGKRELIAEAAALVGCAYLSDLTTVQFRAAAAEALLALPAAEATLAEWQEAANYILQQHQVYASVAEARQALEALLEA